MCRGHSTGQVHSRCRLEQAGVQVVVEDKRQLCVYQQALAAKKPYLWWEFAARYSTTCTMFNGCATTLLSWEVTASCKVSARISSVRGHICHQGSAQPGCACILGLMRCAAQALWHQCMRRRGDERCGPGHPHRC